MRLGDRMYHGIALYSLNVTRVCVSIRSLFVEFDQQGKSNSLRLFYKKKTPKRFN